MKIITQSLSQLQRANNLLSISKVAFSIRNNCHDIFFLLSIPKELQCVKIGGGINFLQEGRNKIQKGILSQKSVPTDQWKYSLFVLIFILISVKKKIDFLIYFLRKKKF